MYSFFNDYSECAHPRVLEAIRDSEQHPGYNTDDSCAAATALIRHQCAAPDAQVHFVVGGTQANLLVIHTLLRSYESVIAADTGHVNVHETGAIEATGHKVCIAHSDDGKCTPALVDTVVRAHSSEHMVQPRLVYISDTTELGTHYTKAELTALRQYCLANGLYLFLDGARLGSALTVEGSDLTLSDLAALTDVFTIGGTKNGALFGEALIFAAGVPAQHFRWYMKQRGAMLAKGWLLGKQFDVLLRDGLYFDLARHANAMAARLREGIAASGYPFLTDSRSNQLFPILPNDTVHALESQFSFSIERIMDDNHSCIRLVTSWATPESAVEDFLRTLPSAR